MTPELLPCPFCGRAPEMDETPDSEGPIVNIHCEHCGYSFFDERPPLPPTIERWNTRSNQEATPDAELAAKVRGFGQAMREHDPRLVSSGYGGYSLGPDDYERIADRLTVQEATRTVGDAEGDR